jgi:hypothetical protein
MNTLEKLKNEYKEAKELVEKRRQLFSDVYDAIHETLMKSIDETVDSAYQEALKFTDIKTAEAIADRVEMSYTLPEIEVPFYINHVMEMALKQLEEAKEIYIEELSKHGHPEDLDDDFYNEWLGNMT